MHYTDEISTCWALEVGSYTVGIVLIRTYSQYTARTYGTSNRYRHIYSNFKCMQQQSFQLYIHVSLGLLMDLLIDWTTVSALSVEILNVINTCNAVWMISEFCSHILKEFVVIWDYQIELSISISISASFYAVRFFLFLLIYSGVETMTRKYHVLPRIIAIVSIKAIVLSEGSTNPSSIMLPNVGPDTGYQVIFP